MTAHTQITSTQIQARYADTIELLRDGPVDIISHKKRQAVMLDPAAYDALKADADEALAARIRGADAEGTLGVEESRRRLAAHRSGGEAA